QLPSFGIPPEKRLPRVVLPALRPLAKCGDVIGAPAWAAAVEIEERDRLLLVDMGVPAMKIPMAEAPLELLARQADDSFAHRLGNVLEISPVVGAVREKRLDRRKRPIDEMPQIELKASVPAHKVVGRYVDRGGSAPIKIMLLLILRKLAPVRVPE